MSIGNSKCGVDAKCLTLQNKVNWLNPHFDTLAGLDAKIGDKKGDAETVSATDIKILMNVILREGVKEGKDFKPNDGKISWNEVAYLDEKLGWNASRFFGAGGNREAVSIVMSMNDDELAKKLISPLDVLNYGGSKKGVRYSDGLVDRAEVEQHTDARTPGMIVRLVEKDSK